jgi:hypothetical protein
MSWDPAALLLLLLLLRPPPPSAGAAGLAAGGPGSLHHQGESGGHVLKQAARGRSVHLWDEDLALAEAQVGDWLTWLCRSIDWLLAR